jgi:hypothetical protein
LLLLLFNIKKLFASGKIRIFSTLLLMQSVWDSGLEAHGPRGRKHRCRPSSYPGRPRQNDHPERLEVIESKTELQEIAMIGIVMTTIHKLEYWLHPTLS